MKILKKWRSRTGNKSLLHKVFSSKRKLSQTSCPSPINRSDPGQHGSSKGAKPKLAARHSSSSIPELEEIDSFESIWATRSDSTEYEEATTENLPGDATLKLKLESSPSFEKELSTILQETIEKLPELDTKVLTIDEKELEIDCSSTDSIVDEELTTPPSSTNAIFSGDFCDYSFASESSGSVGSESTVSPLPKAQSVPRTQDIFRPKDIKQIESPVHQSGAIDEEYLQVKFTPSFEGIEMSKSFQQLQTIEEEPSWYSPSMSFEVDGDSTKQSPCSITQGLKLMMVWILLLCSVCDSGFPLEKVGAHLTELVTPALEGLLVQRATKGPAVHKSFYNSHHTTMGAWLK